MKTSGHNKIKSAAQAICRLYYKVLFLATNQARYYHPEICREYFGIIHQYVVTIYYRGNSMGNVTRGHYDFKKVVEQCRYFQAAFPSVEFRITDRRNHMTFQVGDGEVYETWRSCLGL